MIFKDCFGIDIIDSHWLVVAQQRQGRSLVTGALKTAPVVWLRW